MSEWFCRFFSPCLSKFTQTSCTFQAHVAFLARNPVHSPPALRALDLQVCPHTTLLPHKKPVPTCVNTDLTCMLCGAPNLHALTCMLCGARNSRALHLHVMWSSEPRAPRLLPAFTRSARRRPWRRVQRTAVPAQERSRQRPKPHGRCARPHQDGFHRRSEALQSHRPSRHNRQSCAQG